MNRWINPIILLIVFLLRWQLLQVFAWCTMLVRYSWLHGLSKGWSMTFDGQHPCIICHCVTTGSRAEAVVLETLASYPSIILLPVALVMLGLAPLNRSKYACNE